MSVYNTGTTTWASGLTTISGYGTTWYNNVSAGDLIMKRGDSVAYTVAGVVNDTQLNLNTTYPGPTVSGIIVDIIRDFTANANLPKPMGSDRSDWPVIWADDLDKMDNWSLGWNLTPFTCTYASSTSFTCPTDKTALFTAGTRLKIVHGGGTTYHNIISSAYTSVTTVTVDGTITTPISKVYHSTSVAGISGSDEAVAMSSKAPKASPVFTGDVTLAGKVTNATLPAFLVGVGTTVSDVTGDGTTYDIIFDTEIFDQNANHNPASGIFTAPVTGRYLLSCSVDLRDLAAAHNGQQVHIITSNRFYGTVYQYPSGANPNVPNAAFSVNSLCDMDAGDTAFVRIYVEGGTKIVDVYGNATHPYTRFSGHLVC